MAEFLAAVWGIGKSFFPRKALDCHVLGNSACPYFLLVLGLSLHSHPTCCTYSDLVALLEMRLLTALCHLLRLLDLRGSHV